MKSIHQMRWYASLLIAIVLLPGTAIAETSAQEKRGAQADPADAKAAVPPVIYRSSFNQYRPLGDEKVGNWKAANDKVHQIGGWRAYAKEAREPDVAAPAEKPAAPAAPKPAPDPHSGHEGHKMK